MLTLLVVGMVLGGLTVYWAHGADPKHVGFLEKPVAWVQGKLDERQKCRK